MASRSSTGWCAPGPALEDGRKAVLISMDSTLAPRIFRSGMPLDLLTIERDACRVGSRERIEPGDRRFAAISATWSKALRDGFAELPPWGGRLDGGGGPPYIVA